MAEVVSYLILLMVASIMTMIFDREKIMYDPGNTQYILVVASGFYSERD